MRFENNPVCPFTCLFAITGAHTFFLGFLDVWNRFMKLVMTRVHKVVWPCTFESGASVLSSNPVGVERGVTVHYWMGRSCAPFESSRCRKGSNGTLLSGVHLCSLWVRRVYEAVQWYTFERGASVFPFISLGVERGVAVHHWMGCTCVPFVWDFCRKRCTCAPHQRVYTYSHIWGVQVFPQRV